MCFFFNDTATTEIYTLSLHDALPISAAPMPRLVIAGVPRRMPLGSNGDRKSTRLNSSHDQISYAVFCLKKKKGASARSGPRPLVRGSGPADRVSHADRHLFFF